MDKQPLQEVKVESSLGAQSCPVCGKLVEPTSGAMCHWCQRFFHLTLAGGSTCGRMLARQRGCGYLVVCACCAHEHASELSLPSP